MPSEIFNNSAVFYVFNWRFNKRAACRMDDLNRANLITQDYPNPKSDPYLDQIGGIVRRNHQPRTEELIPHRARI